MGECTSDDTVPQARPAKSQPILPVSFEGIATVTEWHAMKSSSSVPALPDLRPQRGCGNPGLIRC
jgi:hypothetical protein